MANVIKPKHGDTDPPQNALQYGEIGININDLTMFVGTDKGSKKINAGKAENALIANTISETLPISKGGTGNTSRHSALNALFAGGGNETDANIVESGTYVLNTDTGSNLPSESGYYLLSVFRYDTADLACGQLALNLGSNTLYHRAYITGVWREWKTAANSDVEHYTQYYGATNQSITDMLLIDYNNSQGTSNYDCSIGTEDASTIKNSPVNSGPFYAYRRVYQVYSALNNNYKTIVEIHEAYPQRGRVWKREYDPNTGWNSNWSYSFTTNDTIPVSNGGTGATTATQARQNLGAMEVNPNRIEIGENLPSTVNHGGYIDFHFNGSTEDYTNRIIESAPGRLNVSHNFDVSGWLQAQNGIYCEGGGFYVGANNSFLWGTSLPTAGYRGRLFFKKA